MKIEQSLDDPFGAEIPDISILSWFGPNSLGLWATQKKFKYPMISYYVLEVKMFAIRILSCFINVRIFAHLSLKLRIEIFGLK